MAATSAAQSAKKGFAYTIGNRLFFSLTNRTNRGKNHFDVFGPGFKFPASYAPFYPLPDGIEPTPHDLAAIVENAYDGDRWKTSLTYCTHFFSMGESDEGVYFAGQGEPLLKLDTLLETVAIVKENRHGIPFGVETNGLFPTDIITKLKESGVKRLSVQLLTSNPKQYAELANPDASTGGFPQVCAFIAAAVEEEFSVTATAVKAPGVNIAQAKALSISLGADFEALDYFPA